MSPLLEKHKLWDALPNEAEDEGDTGDCDDEGEDDSILYELNFKS